MDPNDRIDVTGWLPNLLGPLDVEQDGEAVDVPRRTKFNLVGATIEDEPDHKRTKITFQKSVEMWHTALDLDFRTDGAQTLSTDGTYTIGKKTWTKSGSANDRAAMAITSSGLEIKPASAGDWFDSTYTSTKLHIPLWSLGKAAAFGRQIRITIVIASDNPTANYDYLAFGISSASAVTGYIAKRGYNTSTRFEVGVIGASTHVTNSRAATLGAGNNVVRLLIPSLGSAQAQLMTAPAGAGGKEIPDEGFYEHVRGVISTSTDISLSRLTESLVLTALRAGGADTAYTAVIARVKVEYFGAEIEDSIEGLSWRIPNGVNNGDGSSKCPVEVQDSGVMPGEAGTSYNVTLRFRGVVEPKTYSSGTNDGASWQVGGTAAVDNSNVYQLYISSPPQTYYLNRGTSGGACAAIDYTKTVTIDAGASVRLYASSIDGAQTNHAISAPGITDPAQPYAGQFIDMTVVRVT